MLHQILRYNEVHMIQLSPSQAQKSTRLLTILGIILLICGLFIWIRTRINDPRAVFEGMLENSIQTRSVTRSTIQGDGVQELNQTVRLQSTANTAQASTVLTQGDGSAVVRTETVGTPQADYVRYNEITTSQTNK